MTDLKTEIHYTTVNISSPLNISSTVNISFTASGEDYDNGAGIINKFEYRVSSGIECGTQHIC